jgi:hypothetical protein
VIAPLPTISTLLAPLLAPFELDPDDELVDVASACAAPVPVPAPVALPELVVAIVVGALDDTSSARSTASMICL